MISLTHELDYLQKAVQFLISRLFLIRSCQVHEQRQAQVFPYLGKKDINNRLDKNYIAIVIIIINTTFRSLHKFNGNLVKYIIIIYCQKLQ